MMIQSVKEGETVKECLEQFSLNGGVTVVTGASEGLGRDMAIGLAKAGSHLVLCSRREEKLREVKAEIEANDGKADVCILDVADMKSIERLKVFLVERFGKVDVLVNNAGFAVTKPTWATTEQEWDAMADTGLKGVYFCCQIISTIMKDKGYGKIINMSSTFSRSTATMRVAYGAIKAGVSHLTESLAVEWAPFGIRVNAIAPTAVRTPSRVALFDEDTLKMLLSRIPLGRLATTDDVTSAAIYLASPASDFITGQTLFVDGGWVANG